jgi:hypothetical protein
MKKIKTKLKKRVSKEDLGYRVKFNAFKDMVAESGLSGNTARFDIMNEALEIDLLSGNSFTDLDLENF